MLELKGRNRRGVAAAAAAVQVLLFMVLHTLVITYK